MLRRRIRPIYCNCYECNNNMDGKLVNLIELLSMNIYLCDDCLKGLNELTSLPQDNKVHQYNNRTKRTY